MSNLLSRIEADLTAAQKSGDIVARDTLRMVKTAIKNKEIEKMATATDDDVVAVLRKEAKSRQEAVDQYKNAGRNEQAAKESREKELIEKYLPAGLSDEELEKIIVESVKSVGATSAADMGKVMGAVMAKVQGRVDGGRVSQIVRSKLT